MDGSPAPPFSGVGQQVTKSLRVAQRYYYSFLIECDRGASPTHLRPVSTSDDRPKREKVGQLPSQGR